MIALFKNSCKRTQNIFVLLAGFYLLSYLLTGMTSKSSNFSSTFLFYLIGAVAIFAMSLNVFHYLHDKTSATHILSLPYTKIQICIVNYLVGLLVIAIPSVIYIVAISITKSLPLTTGLVSALLFILIYYTLGCLIANVTGKVSMHIFMYSILCIAPVLLYTSLLTMISQYVYGMNGPDISSTIIYVILPIARLGLETLNIGYSILYLGYGVGLFILMLYIANKRPFEKTGAPLAFEKIDKIVRFFIVLIVSWLFMTIFTSINNENLPFTCILCAIVVTSIVELIFNKKINILRFAIHVVSVCVITLVVFFASTNYFQYYIPNAPISAKIEFGYESYSNVEIKDQEAITTIKNFHDYLITNTSKNVIGLCDINISYATSSSNSIRRCYSVNQTTYNRAIEKFKQEDGYAHLMNEYYKNIFPYINTEIKSLSIYTGEDTVEIAEDKIERFKQLVLLQMQRYTIDPTLYQEMELHVKDDDIGTNDLSVNIETKKDGVYTSVRIYKNDPIYKALEMMEQESKAN